MQSRNTLKFIAIFISLNFLSAALIYGQIKLVGTVQSSDTKPLQNTSILLLNAKDSALLQGTLSDINGKFSFSVDAQNKYILLFSYLGFSDNYTKPFEILKTEKKHDIGFIILSQEDNNLKAVTISARRPMLEQKIDRMVINVKNSPTSAGNTVLDVLEKSPGIMVNRSNGAISMNGKDGVMVMINGKISYLPANAITQMLNGINANSVEKIELITTPPAKYDAAGNAGYINIVMLNNPNQGFNGSYAASFGVGHGTLPTANINLNYRKNKINLYSNYSFSRVAQLQVFENHRSAIDNGITRKTDGISNRDPSQTNHNARLGVDYQIDKKTIIGGLISGYNNKWEMDAKNIAQYTTNAKIDTVVTLDNHEINQWKHLMGNINLQHTVKEGEEFSINADYLYYNNKNPTNYYNRFYNGKGDFLSDENTISTKKTIIKTFVSQVDYIKKLSTKINCQFGAKAVLSSFTNDVLVAKQNQNTWIPDPKFTAFYTLKEQIGAAYLSSDYNMNEKNTLKVGLRFEYTSSNLGSTTQKNIVDRKYGSFFPTVFFNHKITDQQTFNLSYNRRINRPTFNQLAPFLIFLDPKTFITGNPAIQPSFTNALQFTYIIKKLVLSLNYSYEKNFIASYLAETNPSDNSQIITAQNLDFSKTYYASATLPVNITQWWNLQSSIAINHTSIQGVINKQNSSFSQVYFTMNGSMNFILSKDFFAEISGFYKGKSFLFGADLVNPFGAINVAIQKKFKNKSSSFSFGVDNFLNTMKFQTNLSVPGQNISSSASYQFNYPVFKLSWTQQFGNKVLKDKRNRITASDEERKRVE